LSQFLEELGPFFNADKNDGILITKLFRIFLNPSLEISYWEEIRSSLQAFALGFSTILLFMDFDLMLAAMNTQIRSSSSPINIPMIIIGPSIFYSGIIDR
jgi:hypothetical protein